MWAHRGVGRGATCGGVGRRPLPGCGPVEPAAVSRLAFFRFRGVPSRGLFRSLISCCHLLAESDLSAPAADLSGR